MKIALISDIHMFHWQRVRGNEFSPVNSVLKSLRKEKPDYIIDAGDLEQYVDWGVPGIRVKGNHDYYGKVWDLGIDSCGYCNFKDIKIAYATLWVDLNKGEEASKKIYKRCLNDCYAMNGFTPDECIRVNKEHQEHLRSYAGKVDIVVTHHTPSFLSVHSRYKAGYTEHSEQYKINFGFSSHLDDLVREIKPKFWVHGHTHDIFDYMIDETRVICNPCGYPSEQISIRNGDSYQPVYINL